MHGTVGMRNPWPKLLAIFGRIQVDGRPCAICLKFIYTICAIILPNLFLYPWVLNHYWIPSVLKTGFVG